MTEKTSWRPGTMLYPLPAVLVTCGENPEEWNMITIAWTGITCSDPAMCYISVRPERHSYELLKRTMQFTINLTTADMARATDWAGVRSGRDYNKWKETGLTPLRGEKVCSPTIAQSPVSLECRIKSITPLGSHHMMLAEIVNVRVSTELVNSTTGALELDKASMLAYSHGNYQELGPVIGKFGFSVKKKEKRSGK